MALDGKSKREEAREYAIECRVRRAQLKQQIKAGEANLQELLVEVDLPKWLKGMRPEELLFAIPRLQRRFIHRMIDATGATPVRTLGELTYRQRCKLAQEVAAWMADAPARSRSVMLRRRRRNGTTVRGGLPT